MSRKVIAGNMSPRSRSLCTGRKSGLRPLGKGLWNGWDPLTMGEICLKTDPSCDPSWADVDRSLTTHVIATGALRILMG